MYLHLDMDYFFAQVEERKRPMLKDKVLVVCIYSGRTADSGVVSTVNYAGRAFGIKSGMPISFAKKRAPPDAIFLPADREYYAQVSSEIDSLVRKQFGRVVQASIDEWNIEDADAEKKADVVKNEILSSIGLTCTIGVAPSLLGAKMVAAEAKPNGLRVVSQKSEREMIDNSSIEKIPGIGEKSASALRKLGVELVKDLKKIDPIQLVDIFGRKTGGWLHDLGNGNYIAELGEEKDQEEVSRIGTLKEKSRDPYLILEKLGELEKETKEWLVEMKKSYKTLSIIFILDDLKTHTKSMSFKNPKVWSEPISKEVEYIVKEFLDTTDKEVRRVGIRFGNFIDMGGQTTLF